MLKQPSAKSAGDSKDKGSAKATLRSKMIYVDAFKADNKKNTQEVQAALRSARANELLFRKD